MYPSRQFSVKLDDFYSGNLESWPDRRPRKLYHVSRDGVRSEGEEAEGADAEGDRHHHDAAVAAARGAAVVLVVQDGRGVVHVLGGVARREVSV